LPLVTVLMSVYNGILYIEEAVDSILNQTFSDFQFLIIDNGSNDGSEKYLAGLKDPRVRVIQQENEGLGAALNRGLEEVETKYVARMDADDIALPKRLASQVAFMESHSDVVMLGCHFSFMLDRHRQGFSPPLPVEHNVINDVLMSGGHSVCHPTIVCRMEAVRRTGGYNLKDVAEDHDFMIRMCDEGTVANLKDNLFLYRLHEKSFGRTRYEQVVQGQMFAIVNARRRRKDMEELSESAFARIWNDRSRLRRIASMARGRSDYYYRSSVMAGLKGDMSRRYLYLGLASLLFPKKVLLRFRKALGN
jgi:glycosyltransferase involved in cell wall biosynthesis